MKYIDTHIHLQDFPDSEAEDIIKGLQQKGITCCFCVSACEEDWEKVAKISIKYPDFAIPAFAIHPWYAGNAVNGWPNRLARQLEQFPQALIGECGLDRLKATPPAQQEQAFQIHIDLARKYHRPLLIHAVKAAGWLESFWPALPPNFIMHSFAGPREMLDKINAAGGYAAFNSRIFRHKNATRIIQSVPQNRILFESDAPYQGNAAEIGQLCREIAAIRQEDSSQLAEAAYQNSCAVIKSMQKDKTL